MSLFCIKILATLSMLCDHASKTVLPVIGSRGWLDPALVRWLQIFGTAFGRMALPLFCWGAAEGCRHTHSPERYLGRLLLFAVISEVPFRLSFLYPRMELLTPGCRNVFFTFLLGNAAVLLSKKLPEGHVRSGGALVLAGLALAAAWALHTDYHAFGVALILLLYYAPAEYRVPAMLLWCLVFYIPVQLHRGYSWGLELALRLAFALLACIPAEMYNGERGRNAKWLFYVFYPAHLLLFGLIKQALR